MKDGSQIRIGYSSPSNRPRAVVLYLHTVGGDYTQLSHISDIVRDDNIAYVTYTRSGNDASLNFSKFNFVGRIDELELVLNYIQSLYPGAPIHAIGASAGSALLIRYLGGHNKNNTIKSAVLVSPGYNFMQSCGNMNAISKAYLVNKMKYTIRGLPQSSDLDSVRTLEDWVEFQSKLLGYETSRQYILDCDPVHYLHRIDVPSLFISSLDDSIFDGKTTKEFTGLPQVNPNIMMVVTKRGGHVMFNDEGHDVPWFLRVAREWLHMHT
jgi:predicted alpha/beta-fold hydrolase